ncbi:MAG TPA: hypothetical protein VH107_14970 [Lacipirellulaceae bacterium]|nr:hypothetical protein [Lacipirellulaceae bacterium]
MRANFRHLLTWSLLAAYASIALLGEGLHWLTPDEHHHGASLVVTSTGDFDQASSESLAAAGKHFSSSRAASDDHDCEICEFLAQAVSAPPHVAEVPAFHVLIVEAPLEQPIFDSPIVLGLHAPRGPPPLLA